MITPFSKISCVLLTAILALLALVAAPARAQEVSAEAVLLSEKIAVGETGSLIIRTVNGAPESLPRQIDVPGLLITKGREQFVQSSDPVRGNVSEYLFYYQVAGQKEGTFTIPAQTVRVNNQNLNTNPLEITVYAPKAGDVILDAKRPYFSRLLLDRREFYEGEMIPAELKVYVRGQRSIHDLGRPRLKHDQMVTQGFTEAETDIVQLDGIPFSTASLAGSLFMLSAGEYAVGPAEVEVRMMESSRFGSIGFFQQTAVRKLQSDAVSIAVLPLPEAGKPDTFRGAVGDFSIIASAKPQSLKVGDPISLEFEINGIGNLDSVEAPVFLASDPDQWRSYEARKIVDPSEQSDGRSSGRATFSQIVMPRVQVAEIPSFELAFFNPKTKAYVSRRTDPIPITVAADERANGLGGAATTVAAPGGAFSAPAARSPEASFDDILHISLDTPNWHPSPVPASIFSQSGFWIAQAVNSLLLFSILGVGLARVAKKRAARRAKEASQLSFANAMRSVGDAGSRSEHYHAVQQALDAWKSESAVAPERLPEATRSGFEALQARCQSILYGADDAEREQALSAQEVAENRQVLQAMAGTLR